MPDPTPISTPDRPAGQAPAPSTAQSTAFPTAVLESFLPVILTSVTANGRAYATKIAGETLVVKRRLLDQLPPQDRSSANQLMNQEAQIQFIHLLDAYLTGVIEVITGRSITWAKDASKIEDWGDDRVVAAYYLSCVTSAPLQPPSQAPSTVLD